ncbi:MAG: SDR family NAD(P)-dependent oxidoreductase [Halioglobus sp.]
MSGILEGRVAIITGAGGGLGAAHARVFAAEGCAVVVNDINTPAARPWWMRLRPPVAKPRSTALISPTTMTA